MKSLIYYVAFLFSVAGTAQNIAPAPSIWAAPSTPDSTPELAMLMQATEASITLASYDLVSIHVYGAEALTVRTRIAPNGIVDIPLAGPVLLQGLTVGQAQFAIAKLVNDQGLVVTPAVTVDVLESPSRVITISGQVKNPGVYPVYGDSQLTSSGATPSSGVRTLSQAIGLAGGLKDTASGVITLSRPSLAEPVSIPLGTNPRDQQYASLPVFAGDEIRVSNVGEAYVIGAVKKQGAIPLKNYSPTTVALAVSMSDGLGYEASANDARLVRTVGTTRVSYRVPVRKIIEGKVPDIALQNDDILYIPTNQGKAAIKGGGTALIVSIASAFLYTR